MPAITAGSLGSSGGSLSERHGGEAPPTPPKDVLGENLLLHLGRSLKPLCVSVSSPEKWGFTWPLGVNWGQGCMKTVGSVVRPAWIRDLHSPRWALGQVA